MPVQRVISDGGHPVKVWTQDIDETAEAQLQRLSRLSFIHKHVAVMPDVHAGLGSTVGTVIPTRQAIIPAAVGVDIGCGMVAQKLCLRAEQLPDNLGKVRAAIEQAVPHGRTDRGGVNDKGAWREPQADVTDRWSALADRFTVIADKHPKIANKVNHVKHLGTLGTGNHFIEVCLDERDGVWVMLHSGSRGVGNRIGSYFIELAKQDMRKWFINLPDENLAYLPQHTEHFDDYWFAVSWAQEYAMENRRIMLQATLAAIADSLNLPALDLADEQAVNCHHNYVAMENHFGANIFVTRKGAVRAREGDLGIIPGSMGARSYIVRGLGNPESFHSCSHGAGRRMSRSAAKRQFTEADLLRQTAGVECRKDADMIDEIPGAYKNIDDVMACQSDLVETHAAHVAAGGLCQRLIRSLYANSRRNDGRTELRGENVERIPPHPDSLPPGGEGKTQRRLLN